MNKGTTASRVLWNGAVTATDGWAGRYGGQWHAGMPGFFETMKVSEARILFWEYHLERLSRGASVRGWELPDKVVLRHSLDELVAATGIRCGRLRLQWGRRQGTERPDYLATLKEEECGYRFNTEGWRTGIYKSGRIDPVEAADHKSSYRQVYEAARVWAASSGLKEALLLNEAGFVADGAITNVFWWESGKLYTPPLSAGCVPGVFRAWLMDTLPAAGILVEEAQTTPQRLCRADAVFLTNVIRGVRWVGELDGMPFSRGATPAVHRHLMEGPHSVPGRFID